MMQPEDDLFATSSSTVIDGNGRGESRQNERRRRQHSPAALPPAAHSNSLLESSPSRSNGTSSQQDISPYDPFSPKRSVVKSSLLDTVDEDDETGIALQPHAGVPGGAGYLEMEEEPPRQQPSPYDPIKTSSGLLLTHRRTPPVRSKPEFSQQQQHHDDDYLDTKKLQGPTNLFGAGGLQRSLYREGFEFESWSTPRNWGQRLLSYARMWIVLSALVLFVGTVVIVKHMHLEGTGEVQEPLAGESLASVQLEDTPFLSSTQQTTEQNLGPIVLLPLSEVGGLRALQQQQQQQQQFAQQQQQQLLLPLAPHHRGRRLMTMMGLRNEFESWVSHNGKMYHSLKEKKRRLRIWTDNHLRTIEKNRKHGPCKKTKQPVFGSNFLKDLTQEEFRAQYLTGYTGPTADKEPPNKSSGVLGPDIAASRHPEVHRRLQEVWQQPTKRQATDGAFGTNCKWYDVSCLLSYVFDTYFYGLGRTMEPKYDADSYPRAIDWRDFGAVGEVRAQGNCGACWAITAVETIESAVFIATQTMNELSETEVIVCSDECEMCAGGWPQEAVEYVMDHGGLPLLNDVPYDGDWLLGLSEYRAGNDYENYDQDFDAESASAISAQMCGADSKSNSGDQQNDDGESYNFARYGGEIEGYGYATKKCVCYTDGTGCECNSQNEGMAVRNIATYGPAVVCFDASTWQDYAGGIITSESGCSQGFMDVNHCAQVVGYAYDSDEDDDEDMEGEQNSKSGSGSGSGSRDEADAGSRTGYWIVRNQWSSYWGMSGYAYVAMGENTCGILNDMLLAYT